VCSNVPLKGCNSINVLVIVTNKISRNVKVLILCELGLLKLEVELLEKGSSVMEVGPARFGPMIL
jgi:hypothetical protein